MYIKADIERLGEQEKPPVVYQLFGIPEIIIEDESIDVIYRRSVKIKVFTGLGLDEKWKYVFEKWRIYRKYRETSQISHVTWDVKTGKLIGQYGREAKLDLTEYAYAKNDNVRAYLVGRALNRMAGYENAPFPYYNRGFKTWVKNNIK